MQSVTKRTFANARDVNKNTVTQQPNERWNTRHIFEMLKIMTMYNK